MTSMSDKSMNVSLPEAWSAFEGWLSQHADSNFQALRSPVENADLTAINGGAFAIHPDIRQWLSIHDGCDDLTIGGSPSSFIPDAFAPYSAKAMATAYQEVLENIDLSVSDGHSTDVVGWSDHPLWMPFARSAAGDQLMIDHHVNSFGEVLCFSHEAGRYQAIWPSLGVMLNEMNRAVRGLGTAGPYICRIKTDVPAIEWYHPDYP